LSKDPSCKTSNHHSNNYRTSSILGRRRARAASRSPQARRQFRNPCRGHLPHKHLSSLPCDTGKQNTPTGDRAPVSGHHAYLTSLLLHLHLHTAYCITDYFGKACILDGDSNWAIGLGHWHSRRTADTSLHVLRKQLWRAHTRLSSRRRRRLPSRLMLRLRISRRLRRSTSRRRFSSISRRRGSRS